MGIPVDAALGADAPVQIWEFEGAEGQVVRVRAGSEAFDPELVLTSPTGNCPEGWQQGGPLVSDCISMEQGDDGNSDGFLEATLPRTGPYWVIVRAADRATGPYQLAVHVATSSDLEMGAPVRAVLRSDVPVGVWEFEGAPGQIVSVAARSAAFYPQVEVKSPSGRRLAWDYADGPGDEARLLMRLTSAGRFQAQVRAAYRGTGLNTLGRYRLAVHSVASTRLEMGRPVDAALGKGEVEIWEFEGVAGQIVSVMAGWEAFHLELDLVSPSGDLVAWAGGHGGDAWLVATLPSAGRYRIVARSAHGRTGPYRLAVHSGKSRRLEMDRPVDATLSADAPVEIWEFAGAEGQLVSVEANSGAFDPQLQLLSPKGELVASEGDGVLGDGAWLVETLPASGRYQIVASAAHGGMGRYGLAVHAVKARALEMGRSVDAALGAEALVERWEFDGAAGQVVSITADSKAFFPELELYSPTGNRLRWNHYHGSGADAGLFGTLPAAGRYEVRVLAIDRRPGPYRLAVRSVPLRRLEMGAPVDALLGAEALEGRWEFEGAAGQVVTVEASSEAFDPQLRLRSPSGEPIATNMDGGPGANVQLLATLPTSGRYQVWVLSETGRAGAYRVAVHAVEERLELDTRIDSVLHSNGVGRWVFEGTAGQMVTVEANSGAFDLQLQLRSPSGELLASDGDGGPGADAWLAERLPSAGPHQVWVRAPDGRTGSYRVAVRTAKVLEMGAPVQAVLGGGSVGIWAFKGAADQRISVEAGSDVFESAVEVWSPAGERIAWEDARVIGPDIRRLTTLPTTGRYEVRVWAVGGATGPYHVSVGKTSAPKMK